MGRIVGRITEVKGLSVKSKLDELLPPYLVENGERETAPKINGFVKTKVGIETIICQVVGEYSEEVNGKVQGHYLSIQVRGNITDGKFIQGLRMLPIVSATIETLDPSDYKLIYQSSIDPITIGVDLFDENKNIEVNINKLIPSHLGVFGNTGSGKSNTLVKILNEYSKILYSKKTMSGKFLVFDINNEYSNNSIYNENEKIIYNLKTRVESEKKIPLSLKDLTEDEFIVLMNASEKTQVPVIKTAYRYTFSRDDEKRPKDYYLNVIKSMINNNRKGLFFSMRHHLSEYFKNLDSFKYNGTTGNFYYQEPSSTVRLFVGNDDFNQKLKLIELELPSDQLDRFLFEIYFAIAYENENGVQLDFMMPLVSRANKLISDFKKVFDFSISTDKETLFSDKNICVIQLGNVNKDMKEIIPSLISNHIFNKLADKKEETEKIVQIINIVIDEAHNILYDESGQSVGHKNVLEVFEKIVKEGRKFGCFLMLASQRPSDISQTIISQLHNYFIHKLVNPSDIQKIRKAVAYLDDDSLDFITVLAPGECIVSGTAFQMPSFVYVQQVQKHFRPNSENVILIGKDGLFEKNRDNTDEENSIF
ncbi:ATP-binding protein [Erysipelothrix rhusiopathiae]|nr:ATP-binding protein [Erysipelothrix rhusiopathiae]